MQYSELMQNCVRPISDGSNLSFKYKQINNKRYWYLYISIGSTRREHYLGEDSQDLVDQIDDEKALWESDTDDRELRQRLVNMLLSGGMTAPNRDEGKALSLLERNGVSLAGATLVGTIAFAAKALKDQSQAEQLFEVLLDSRPADISLAFEAAKNLGDAFVSDFRAGLRLIDKDVAGAVNSQIEGKRP